MRKLSTMLILAAALAVSACDDNDPVRDPTPVPDEIIEVPVEDCGPNSDPREPRNENVVCL